MTTIDVTPLQTQLTVISDDEKDLESKSDANDAAQIAVVTAQTAAATTLAAKNAAHSKLSDDIAIEQNMLTNLMNGLPLISPPPSTTPPSTTPPSTDPPTTPPAAVSAVVFSPPTHSA